MEDWFLLETTNGIFVVLLAKKFAMRVVGPQKSVTQSFHGVRIGDYGREHVKSAIVSKTITYTKNLSTSWIELSIH